MGDELSAQLARRAGALAGEEAVMELVQELQDIAPAVVEEERAAAAAAAASGGPAGAGAAKVGRAAAGPPSFGRRWVWAQTVTKPGNRAKAVAATGGEVIL